MRVSNLTLFLEEKSEIDLAISIESRTIFIDDFFSNWIFAILGNFAGTMPTA